MDPVHCVLRHLMAGFCGNDNASERGTVVAEVIASHASLAKVVCFCRASEIGRGAVRGFMVGCDVSFKPPPGGHPAVNQFARRPR